MKALGTMFVVLLCLGCDAGSSGGSKLSGDGSVPTGGTGGDVDAAAAECPFPLDSCRTVSCSYDTSVCDAACANLSGDLAECSAGVDMAMCMTACEFSVAESRCANILFGCASENDRCKAYVACQEDKFSAPPAPKDAGQDASP